MPIYEYECRKCKAHLEVMQKISDKPLAKCRKCGGQLEKQWSNTSFQLKGAGWYMTDYAAKKSESPAAAEDGKKSDATAEPAAKESKEKKESAATEKKEPVAKKTRGTKSAAPTGNAGD